MNIAHTRAGGQPMEAAAEQSSAQHTLPGRASAQSHMMKPLWSTAASALIVGVMVCVTAKPALGDEPEIKFDMVRSAGVAKAGCLPNAKAKVNIESEGAVEHMRVKVEGLPPNTDFDFFVIQSPTLRSACHGTRETSRPMGAGRVRSDLSVDSASRPSSSPRTWRRLR